MKAPRQCPLVLLLKVVCRGVKLSAVKKVEMKCGEGIEVDGERS
jgi:hypothetical protein